MHNKINESKQELLFVGELHEIDRMKKNLHTEKPNENQC